MTKQADGGSSYGCGCRASGWCRVAAVFTGDVDGERQQYLLPLPCSSCSLAEEREDAGRLLDRFLCFAPLRSALAFHSLGSQNGGRPC